jgi:hypothetical protein
MADQFRSEAHAHRDAVQAQFGGIGMENFDDHSGHAHANDTTMESAAPQRELLMSDSGNPMRREDFNFGLN